MDIPLRIEAAHFTSNDPDNPKGWNLTVSDALSGVRVVNLRLTPEQFYGLMRGGVVRVDEGFVNTEHTHKVGKKMRNWSQVIPREVTGYGSTTTAEARVWAERNAPEPYDSLEIRSTNRGLEAIYRRWDLPSTEDIEQAKEAY